jgi:hypothetical protein
MNHWSKPSQKHYFYPLKKQIRAKDEEIFYMMRGKEKTVLHAYHAYYIFRCKTKEQQQQKVLKEKHKKQYFKNIYAPPLPRKARTPFPRPIPLPLPAIPRPRIP